MILTLSSQGKKSFKHLFQISRARSRSWPQLSPGRCSWVPAFSFGTSLSLWALVKKRDYSSPRVRRAAWLGLTRNKPLVLMPADALDKFTVYNDSFGIWRPMFHKMVFLELICLSSCVKYSTIKWATNRTLWLHRKHIQATVDKVWRHLQYTLAMNVPNQRAPADATVVGTLSHNR